MLLADIIKSVLVGALVAAPPGPACMLVIRKTLTDGRMKGLATGVGPMLADVLFALLAFLTLPFIRDFFDENGRWIYVAGGLFVLGIGVSLVMHAPSGCRRDAPSDEGLPAGSMVQAFICSIANPGAFALMVVLQAFFGVDSESGLPLWAVIPAIAAGEMLWWTFVTGMAAKGRDLLAPRRLTQAIRLLGGIVCAFALFLIVKGVLLIL
ncbi:MAG: LysE family transporter [Bacteroidales bacterium]|nr:LysE family transporter [Bacteroidales bacterium]